MKHTTLLLIILLCISCKTYKTESSNLIELKKKEAIIARITNLEKKINELKNNFESKNEIEDLLAQLYIEKKNLSTSETITNKEVVIEKQKSNLSEIDYINEKIVTEALNQLGSRYVTGGTTKSGYDCSGLVFSLFKKLGYILPRTSLEMSRYGRNLSKEEYRKGDLIFFKTLNSKIINHVGLVIDVSPNEIKFIHSSIKKGVIITSLNDPYYQKAFSHINRVIE